MSRTNQIVVTGLNDAWGRRAVIFPSNWTVTIRLDTTEPAGASSWKFINLGELRLALWQVVSIIRGFWPQQNLARCLRPSRLKSRRWQNNNLESRRKKFNQASRSLEAPCSLWTSPRGMQRDLKVWGNNEYIGSTRFLESENLSRN